MSEARALVIGEALVDVVVHADGERDEHPGGSPANVAVGLARLGRPADLLTWLAPDAYGARVKSHLEASGVHVLAVARLVTDWHGQKPLDLPGGIRAARAGGHIVFSTTGSTEVLPHDH